MTWHVDRVHNKSCAYNIHSTLIDEFIFSFYNFQRILDSYAIDESKIKIFEIENEPDMNEIQSYMGEITGGRTVPRIFVGGQFVGGAEELVSLHYSQRLDQILSSGGALQNFSMIHLLKFVGYQNKRIRFEIRAKALNFLYNFFFVLIGLAFELLTALFVKTTVQLDFKSFFCLKKRRF